MVSSAGRRNVTVLLMWLMLSTCGFNIATAGSIWGIHSTVHVQILNYLDKDDLTLTCRSKDTNLGVHTLKPKEQFDFHFKPNFWGTTVYYCRFQWTNNDHTFDVYSYERDNERCRYCYLRVSAKDLCKFSYDTKKYDSCNEWALMT
jgi:hypothetical protein